MGKYVKPSIEVIDIEFEQSILDFSSTYMDLNYGDNVDESDT